MRRARRHQKSKAFREAKRHRQVAEHRIARLRQLGAKQARYMGRAKTLFQLLMVATVANLTLVAGVGSGAFSLFFALVGYHLRPLAAWTRHIGSRKSWQRQASSAPRVVFATAPSLKLFALGIKNGGFRPDF